MIRLTLALVAVALGAATAVGLVSCGGDDEGLLPGETAAQIAGNLDRVEELAAAGRCDEALAAALEVGDQVEALGPGVDPELRRKLAEGADALEEQALSDCEETVTETTETTDIETEPTETEPTETTETETTDTETEPTETETTQTTPTQTTPTEPTPTVPIEPGPVPPDSGGISPGGGD